MPAYKGYSPRGRIPEYENPSETKAYLEGYEHGFFNHARSLTHIFINAYSKGYWNGFHDDAQAFSEGMKER